MGEMAEREKFFGDGVIETLGAYLLACPVFIGPGIVVFQVIEWLRTGKWHPVPVSAGLDYLGIAHPTMSWIGAQKVIDFILDFPLSVVVFGLYIAVLSLVL